MKRQIIDKRKNRFTNRKTDRQITDKKQDYITGNKANTLYNPTITGYDPPTTIKQREKDYHTNTITHIKLQRTHAHKHTTERK